MRNVAFRVSLTCLLLTLLLPTLMLATEKIVLVTPRAEDEQDGKFFTLVYTEAFSRLGMEFVYAQYPSKRCTYLAENGLVAGEMERVYDFNSIHPDLLRVEEALRTIKFAAFGTNPAITVEGWQSLKDTGYVVNYRSGLKKCEEMLLQVVEPTYLQAVTHQSQGIKKLIAGRIDLYVDLTSVVEALLATEEFAQYTIYEAGVLEEISTHTFLHKQHQELVPRLSAVLKAMKEEGLLTHYATVSAE